MFPIIDKYLQRSAFLSAQIASSPALDLQLIIVIPAHQEPDLLATLESLTGCSEIPIGIEVITVFNESEAASSTIHYFHQEQVVTFRNWKKKYLSIHGGINKQESINFEFIHAERLPKKKAGVGLARKIGMDEAVHRWNTIGKDGPIICLDADTLVQDNYLSTLTTFFQQYPKCPGVNIHYEHPLEGLAPEARKAIVQYELHLRYFLEAKRWAGFPFAYETVGSAMGVRAQAYAAQGGMNTRKAGEDFYFLNKFIPLKHFAEITSTTVFPSARISDRVPFGTGRAIGDMLEQDKKWTTYSPRAFQELQFFFSQIPTLFVSPEQWKSCVNDEYLEQYLLAKDFEKVLTEIKSNTADYAAFYKRFFRWFDAFQIMKCLHFLEEKGIERVSVEAGATWLLEQLNINSAPQLINIEDLLVTYRQMAKSESRRS